jgi:hypothetical protein
MRLSCGIWIGVKPMPATARTCLHCDTRHWSTQPCPAQDKPKAERVKKVAEAITIKSKVTIKAPVTIKDDIEKRSVTGRGGKRPGAGRKPNGGSEAVRKRVAAHRARRKADKAGSLTLRDGVGAE